MNKIIFKICVSVVALIFLILFCYLIIPPFFENPDIFGAFAAGFVNPYSSGYSVDVICCWAILCIWIIYEMPKVKYGWICMPLGLVPGVAVGFALYLLLRLSQSKPNNSSHPLDNF